MIPGKNRIDPVVRRQQFETDHPDVTIVPPGSTVRGDRWLAIVPFGKVPRNPTGTTIGAWKLENLMDQLDEIYSPGDGASGEA
jgi:hypothetical protein